MIHSRYRASAALAYMAGIYVLSSIPGNQADTEIGRVFMWVQPNVQNLLHVPLFGGLALCWYWSLAGYAIRPRLITSLAIATLCAVFDEWHQMGVPGRYASWTDLLLNLLGIGLAAAGILYARRRRLLA